MSITRIISAFIWCCALTYIADEMYIRQEEVNPDRKQVSKYYLNFSGPLLPGFAIVFFVVDAAFYGIEHGLHRCLSYFFIIFLEIGLYYVILIPLIPLLRKYINSRTLALLWFVPNYLYIVVAYNGFEPAGPGMIINIPNNILPIVLAVWLAGFVTVMAVNIFRHLSFRKFILKNAVEVTDNRLLDILDKAVKEAAIAKPKFKLVISPGARTPMSIGLFKKAVRIVLPDINYTDGELKLILKHEVIHIAREDGWSKFAIVFNTAMCWFNPFMWSAMKRRAEDLELSCDEAVLLNEKDESRRQYARLILSTAGDERGFTTCLSASAKALMYRLKSITKPVARIKGSAIIGVAFFMLVMACGTVVLAYDRQTGRQYVFTDGHYSRYTLRSVGVQNVGDIDRLTKETKEDFMEYISGLEMCRVTGEFKPGRKSSRISFHIEKPGDRKFIYLYDDAIFIRGLGKGALDYYYHLPQGVDFEHLNSLLNI